MSLIRGNYIKEKFNINEYLTYYMPAWMEPYMQEIGATLDTKMLKQILLNIISLVS